VQDEVGAGSKSILNATPPEFSQMSHPLPIVVHSSCHLCETIGILNANHSRFQNGILIFIKVLKPYILQPDSTSATTFIVVLIAGFVTVESAMPNSDLAHFGADPIIAMVMGMVFLALIMVLEDDVDNADARL
jgi:di/tricarboxylate transporter